MEPLQMTLWTTVIGIKNDKVKRSGINLNGDLVGSVNGLDVQLVEEQLSMIFLKYIFY